MTMTMMTMTMMITTTKIMMMKMIRIIEEEIEEVRHSEIVWVDLFLLIIDLLVVVTVLHHHDLITEDLLLTLLLILEAIHQEVGIAEIQEVDRELQKEDLLQWAKQNVRVLRVWEVEHLMEVDDLLINAGVLQIQAVQVLEVEEMVNCFILPLLGGAIFIKKNE